MALVEALHGLLRLPGATYSCVVERDSGRVLAETGDGAAGSGDGEGVVPYSVARWGTAVAAMFDATAGDELDDVMITGKRSYHLVRPLGPSASVLVYLRLDRARSNLAAARRELAAVRWGGGPAGSDPDPRPAGVRPAGSAAGPRAVGPAADRPPAGSAAGLRAVGPAADRSPEGSAAGLRPVGSVADRRPEEAAAGLRPVGPDPVRAAAERPATRVPASLPPSGTPARGLAAVAGRIGVVGVSRSALPEPGTAPVIPLPRRAPSASPVDAPGRRADGPGAEADDAPRGFAMPAVLGQSWARDPRTLRRLIAGLRRMS